jgi:hypothetical protein
MWLYLFKIKFKPTYELNPKFFDEVYKFPLNLKTMKLIQSKQGFCKYIL